MSKQQQGKQQFAADYIDVATRLVEFREKYPDGSLQPADPATPYRIEQLGDQTYIVVVAAAYRAPDDPRPGIGMAYEQFPGRTPYTRGSELQNAETSAWGRAIVAALAADTKRGIVSADEMRSHELEPLVDLKRQIWAEAEKRGWITEDGYTALAEDFTTWSQGDSIASADQQTLKEYLAHLRPVRKMQRSA
jgi:hypothetical protein